MDQNFKHVVVMIDVTVVSRGESTKSVLTIMSLMLNAGRLFVGLVQAAH